MAYPYTHEKEVRVLSKYFGDPEARTVEGWKARGGYQTLQKAFEMGRDAIIDEVKASGLRGRGGAGFPAGVKWSFMPKEKTRPHYLLCNADESEPGTFKDRELLRWTPHQLIEGMIISAYAIQAEECYVYCRGEFFETTQVLAKAVEDAYAAGYLGKDILGSGVNVDITVHCGGGAYICGEETALMNSLEGRRGTPRVKPPFPAQAGYMMMPSTVNNVETLSSIPFIIQDGADAYRANGTPESPGTKLFCVSGHVRKPGNYELPLGFPLMELINDVCGGLKEGRTLKGVIPGGSSVPILNAEECADCQMSFEGVIEAGSQLGCAAVIVMDDSTDIVKAVRRMVDFYTHESCGQCTPCREGSAWTGKILRRIEDGRGTEGDLDTLVEITSQMEGTTICVLSDSVAAPVQSSIKKYREEYLARIRTGEKVGEIMTDQQSPNTVTLSIDGNEVTVPTGTTILHAAKSIGIEIPHYCYHPGLSSPAMCRLCLVEVDGWPKPAPACKTAVADGQVVYTNSELAQRQRTGVLEFYLVNHPLDCPICDQSGECQLQDYVFQEGREHGRGREPKRVLGRDDFGGDVLFNGDRCVMCTRCVRFMREVAEDERLCVVERGSRAVIDTFFEEGLEGSPYAGNIVDICPVGALISKDFLHKARAWDLDRTPSVCPSCSQGCNITLQTRDDLVQRLKPRENLEVNGWWMCDFGRHNYEWMNRADRVEGPLVNGATKGWSEALQSLFEALKKADGTVKAVTWAHSPNEEMGLLKALLGELGGGDVVYRSPRTEGEVPLPGFPLMARREDLAPNVNGAELMGFGRVGDKDAKGGLDEVAGHGGVLFVVGDPLEEYGEDFGSQAELFVYLGSYSSKAAKNAHVVLPITTFAEQEGSFTNVQGRVQRFWPGIRPPGSARPGWLILGALLAELTETEAPASADQAFARLASGVSEFAGIFYRDLGTRGAMAKKAAGVAGD